MASMNYESAGVKYDTLDAFKRACQREAATTVDLLAAHGMSEVAGIRGESAYLIETDDDYIAHVEEGLGTKNLVADAMGALLSDKSRRLTNAGESFYRGVGIDTVATIVNDLITVGALPISVAMHAAVADGEWFADEARAADLASGFAEGCRQANAVWGGGETPALRGLVEPGAIILAGSAVGRIHPKELRIKGDVRDGDAIVFLASSGVHTNGLTLCRAVAEKLPEKYETKQRDGRPFGEALLDPSIIYVNFIAGCQAAGIAIHYAVHVTGHGWRKLMRLAQPFVYQIDLLVPPPPVFDFIAKHGPVDEREMYATFNMGVGFAVYVDRANAEACVKLAKRNGYDAWVAGRIVREGDRKAVEITPLDIAFEADELKVR